MRFSVIIPVYNSASTLTRCVDSVLSQDFKDYEVLLIDDGSTDPSPKICDRYLENGISRVIHQENLGLGGARNTGIRSAAGEYLVFLDSDDMLRAGMLARINDLICKCHADLYGFGFDTMAEGRTLATFREEILSGQVLSAASEPRLLTALPNSWCRVAKRELYVNNDIFFPERVWFEDLRTSPKLAAVAGSVVWLNESWYYYVQQSTSIMHSSNLDRNREIMDAFDDLLAWFSQRNLLACYHDQLQTLCIDHLYIAASDRILRQDPKHPLLPELRTYIRSHFPDYASSSHIAELTEAQRLAFRLLEKKQYRVLSMLFRLKDVLQSKKYGR